jgi:23S rRNA (cytidine1920-2'-O)/16S rRNA (cytidine1409-2'-O)-methyltransferase
MDVSFISATLVLPAVVAALAPAGEAWLGEAVILVKPQFEAGREHVGKGGIVRDPAAHQLAVHRVEDAVRAIGGQALALIDSPILGMEGNREFLLHARFR